MPAFGRPGRSREVMLRFLAVVFGLLVLLAIGIAGGGLYVFYHYGRGLPDYTQLADYQPPVTTRIHAGDGRLLAEYAVEKRVFVPVRAMPRRVVNAFLAAEDKNFYAHFGLDPTGIVRAAATNLKQVGEGRRPVGASTITQQVAKNFLIGNEVSYERKIKEAILAFRIEQALSKDRILELYLNEIYLGFGSYGVAAAALNYFNKSLDELSVAEAAFLAALPKAPNNYNPLRYPDAARGRRDWVIGRMLEDGHIGPAEAEQARSTPLVVRQRAETEFARADYFAEEVRRELAARFGEDKLYKGGLSVRTTLDPRLQTIARRTLRAGLEAYDRRHGFRGPIARLGVGGDWPARIPAVAPPSAAPETWKPAVVLAVNDQAALLGLAGGAKGALPLAEMRWARKTLEHQRLGPPLRSPAEALAPGDVVLVEPAAHNAEGAPYPEGTYALRQVPEVEGALVVLDPHTGRVLAMAGGYGYERSQFNRATQAARQTGSAFKPFVYLAALAEGYTPSTLILDAPFVMDQGPGLPKWRPANYTNEFYGPSTMRLGVEKSRNLMTVRLAQTIGMEKVAATAERFGVFDHLPRQLSMALGSGETTPLRLTTAYAMLVNGGKRVTPTVIDRVQDRNGRTVFRHDARSCPECRADYWINQPVPQIPDAREAVTDPATAYQVVSMLQGVVERGTGIRIREVGKPLAGKTGTTNDYLDAWFVGFSPDLVAGVFVGFDTPKSLGDKETGSAVAVPIFKRFMEEALAEQPAIPFRVPPGIRLVRVNAKTGLPAGSADRERDVILEAFKPDRLPTARAEVLAGLSDEGDDDGPSGIPGAGLGTAGPGGLY
jgi:penicillin-binding protein 1A